MTTAKIGIIGGSGITELFTPINKVSVHTPYGAPSDDIQIGELNGVKVAFLARHGKAHKIPPHKINYRANLFSLKHVGVEKVVGVSAVGSLKEKYRPGDLVLVDQFIDFTKSRQYTYFDGPQVAHISMADPFCESLRTILANTAKKHEIKVHESGTYVCIEGPRFSTRAESRMFRSFAEVIGMTLVPEITLARELGMCYTLIATITDFDVWAEKPVNTEEVLRVMKENEHKVKLVLKNSIVDLEKDQGCDCKKDIKAANI